jgi:hypothetical protein
MIVGEIKQSWLESGAIYGYRKIHDDLRELGLQCGEQRGVSIDEGRRPALPNRLQA